MGALEIRRSSAQLNNLGQIHTPVLDNGSARVYAARAEAAKAAAQAARTAGMAAVEGISRRGQIVARAIRDAGDAVSSYFEEENDRVATDEVLKSEQERSLYMYGDGTEENPGQLNVTLNKDGRWDAGTWMEAINQENRERDERHLKNLNYFQKRIYREEMAKRDRSWQNRINSYAARRTLEARIATATSETDMALDDAARQFGDSKAREEGLMEYQEKMTKLQDLRGVPAGAARQLDSRRGILKLIDRAVDYKIGEQLRKTSQGEFSDNPEMVALGWDEFIKKAEESNGEFESPVVKAMLGNNGMTDAEKSTMMEKLRRGRDQAVVNAQKLYKLNVMKVDGRYDQAERDVVQNPSDEEFSLLLEKWASDAELKKYDPARAERYAKYATAIRTASEMRQKGIIKANPDAFRPLKKEEQLQDDLLNEIGRINVARACGINPYEVQRMQFDAVQKYQIALRSGLVDAEFKKKFENTIGGELKVQTVKAMRKWYDVWGVHPEIDSNGRVSARELANASGDVLLPTAARTRDGENGRLSKRQFYELTSELIGTVESAPDDFNREEVMDRVIENLQVKGLSIGCRGEIDAATEVGKIISQAMLDVSGEDNYMRMFDMPGSDGDSDKGLQQPQKSTEDIQRRRDEYRAKRKENGRRQTEIEQQGKKIELDRKLDEMKSDMKLNFMSSIPG